MLLRHFSFCFSILLCPFLYSQGMKVKLTEHTANVESVAYSPDGKYLASGGWDGRVNLYTIDSFGNPLLKLKYSGHMGAITTLAFSKNSKYLVSSSKDYSTRVWNIDTPSKHKVFNLHSENVTSSFLDPTNKFLITSSLDGTIRTTNLNDKSKSKVIKLSGPINDLQLSRDAKYFFAAIKGGIIKQYETGGANNEVMVFNGHTDEVNAIDVSPDGGFIASASSDKTILIWDITTGKSIKKLDGFEWKVTSVKYTLDGKYLVGGCNDGMTKLFNIETGKAIVDMKTLGHNVRDVAISRDGKQVAVATHMETEKFGAILYNTGIVVNPDAVVISTKPKPKTAAGNKTKPLAKKTNGTK